MSRGGALCGDGVGYMLKQHSQLIGFIRGCLDLMVAGIAWMAAYCIRFDLLPHNKGIPPLHDVIVNLILFLGLIAVCFNGVGAYKPRRIKSIIEELRVILFGSVIAWMLLLVCIYYIEQTKFTRGLLLMLLPLSVAMLLSERLAARIVLNTIRRNGWNLRYAIIVGSGRLAQKTLYRLRENSWTGIRVVGFVAEEDRIHGHIRGLPILGNLDDLPRTIETQQIDSVFVAMSGRHARSIRRVMKMLEDTAVDVRVIPDIYGSPVTSNLSVSELDGMPVISVRENPLEGWRAIYKRTFDIGGASLALLVFALPMLLIALAIKLTSRGPILYRQQRISFGGKPFDILKFRSMVITAEHESGATLAVPNDPRCTAVGRWLRRTSLDELPQLFNVLAGHMSLVGPRPERPELMARIRREVPGFPMRLKVRAGITGWAQINGYRGDTSFRKRLQYDLYYVHNWSPLLDIKIMFMTLFRGFRHPNAY